MKKLIFAALLFQACGDQTAQELLEEQAILTQSGGVERTKEEKEIVIEYRKDGLETTLVVVKTADLPSCDNANSAQKVYVKEHEAFFTCVQSVWVEGAKSVKTEASKAESEAISKPEPIPGQGETPKIDPKPDFGSWIDPMTKRQWMITGNISDSQMKRNPPCSAEYSLPSQKELSEAIVNGLAIKAATLGSYQGFWTNATVQVPLEKHPQHYWEYLLGLNNEGEQVTSEKIPLLGAACLKQTP